MSGPRLALVADDPRLASAIQAHLAQEFGQAALACRGEAVREHLQPHGPGLLLVAAATPAEAEAAAYLVREAALQKLPSAVVVLAGEDLAEPFAGLDGHLAARLRWPEGAADLVKLARDRLGRLPPLRGLTPPAQGETVFDVIHRRLLSFTPSLLPLLERIALAAVHDVTVLLTGETGTGKTHLAKLMHDCSPRRTDPFLSVPCGAQPANLVESVFFGHVKGAFTGADRNKVGKFAAAGKGTLLLDEIDTLGLEAQAGLLRVIESGDYEPVGSNDTQRCQARLIVASNWDLEEATRQGRFRPDLYYRLNVMSFHLPPLRERVQDIAPLVRAITARYNTKFRKQLLDVGAGAMAALENYDWPGNIRQLENVVQQGVLVSKGTELRVEDLPAPVRAPAARANGPPARANGAADGALLRISRISRENAERSAIEQALLTNNYSRSRTARSLGISRVTLYKKMKKYGLDAIPRRALGADEPIPARPANGSAPLGPREDHRAS